MPVVLGPLGKIVTTAGIFVETLLAKYNYPSRLYGCIHGRMDEEDQMTISVQDIRSWEWPARQRSDLTPIGGIRPRDWEPRGRSSSSSWPGTGGGADQIARFIQSVAQKNDMTPRPLVPENRGGGSGAEALIAVANSNSPDHTLLVTLNSFFTTPLRQENLGIDIMDFTPIEMMGVDPFVLWVNNDGGITTFEQWRREGEAKPDGEYVMGGTGEGQEDSLVIGWLEKPIGIDVKYVPFSGGGEVAEDARRQPDHGDA